MTIHLYKTVLFTLYVIDKVFFIGLSIILVLVCTLTERTTMTLPRTQEPQGAD